MTVARRRGVMVALAGALLVLVQAVAPLGAADYDTPGTRPTKDALPKELPATGPNYKINSPVGADGFMYHFSVSSTYGNFEVTGLGALRKLLNEIRAITALREIKKSKAWLNAVADSATGPFRLGKSLITHPVDTVSGVPRGTYKLMEDAAEAVTSEKDPSDDPAYKKALLVSGRKREYAAQMGVDGYSSNTVLQKDLNSVAWAAAIGNLTVSAALMPVGGAAGTAVTLTRWSTAANDYLKAEPASRLRIINDEKFKVMGIPADVAKRYLDHPVFTPRHDTIIAEALSQLGTAVGRDRFLERALLAEDEADANFFTTMAQLLRGYHTSVAPIAEIQVVGGRLVVARANNGRALVALPLDFVMWTATAQKRVEDLKAQYRPAGFNGTFDFWLTGTASPVARQQLTDRGITVSEEVGKRVEILD